MLLESRFTAGNTRNACRKWAQVSVNPCEACALGVSVRQVQKDDVGRHSGLPQARPKVWLWSFYICGASRGSFVPLDKGDAALFAAGGLEFTAEGPLWSPFSRGTNVNSQTRGRATGQTLPSAHGNCKVPVRFPTETYVAA